MEVFGSVDRCDEFVIEGWVTIHGEPDKKLCLDVCLDETLIGQCIADRYRDDLKQAGLADGLCAFRFDMPSFVRGTDLEKLRLRLNNSVLFFDLKKQDVENVIHAVPDQGDGATGFWIDKPDWLDQLALKFRTNKISDELSSLIFQFVRDGFVLMEKALSSDIIDRLNDAIELVRRRPPHGSFGDDTVSIFAAQEDGSTLFDLYAYSAVAREALAAPEIIEFLLAIFENRPKAFYNETYLRAAQRTLHRDSDGLEIAKKRNFAGVWIALEDIAEGSGELECLVGSHRSASGFLGPRETDTASNAALYIDALKRDAERFAQISRRFILKKGDLLILHPDLAYQDSNVSRSGATRRSLLTYFMPFHEEPHYTGSLRFKGLAAAGCHFISQFSDVPSA